VLAARSVITVAERYDVAGDSYIARGRSMSNQVAAADDDDDDDDGDGD